MKHPASTTTAPGAEAGAAVLADAACALHDTAGPGLWSLSATEDAVEGIETTLLALAEAHPQAGLLVASLGMTLAELRRQLGLPARESTYSRPVAGR